MEFIRRRVLPLAAAGALVLGACSNDKTVAQQNEADKAKIEQLKHHVEMRDTAAKEKCYPIASTALQKAVEHDVSGLSLAEAAPIIDLYNGAAGDVKAEQAMDDCTKEITGHAVAVDVAATVAFHDGALTASVTPIEG